MTVVEKIARILCDKYPEDGAGFCNCGGSALTCNGVFDGEICCWNDYLDDAREIVIAVQNNTDAPKLMSVIKQKDDLWPIA